MNKKIDRLFLFSFFLLVGIFVTGTVEAQTCPNLTISVRTLQPVACNSAGGRGSIEIVLSEPIDHSTLVFRTATALGVRRTAPGGLIIEDIPYAANLFVESEGIVPCLGQTVRSANFDMSYGLQLDQATISAVHCQDAATATIKATASGGTGNYTYELLSNGVVVAGPNNIGVFNYGEGGQTYTIRVRDDGCTVSPIPTVISNPFDVKDLRSLNLIQGELSVCPGGTIRLSASLPGVITYTWEDPQGIRRGGTSVTFTTNATSADSGKYTLFLTTPEGCDYTESVVVRVANPPSPVIQPIQVCVGSAAVSLADHVTTTDNNYSLVWYEQDGVTERSTAPSVPANTVGTVTYYAAQRDKVLLCQGNPAPVPVEITALPNPIASGSVSIFINPADPNPVLTVQSTIGYNYNLYAVEQGGTPIGGTGIATTTSTKVTTTTVLNLNTTYYLSTANEKGCLAPARTPIAIGSVTPLISGPATVCLGASFTLISIVPNASAVAWTLPNGGGTFIGGSLTVAVATLSYSGTYRVRVETAEGIMEDSHVLEVKQTDTPQVDEPTVSYCQGETAVALQATAAADHTLQWYDQNGFIGTTAPTPVTETVETLVYYVSQKNNFTQCEGDRMMIRVVINALPPAVQAATLSSCIADIPNVTIANTDAAYTYSLYTAAVGGVQEGSSVNGNGATIHLTGTTSLSAPATYYVEVRNSNGCIASSRTPIQMVANSNLITGTSDVCEGGTIRMSATAITGAVYTWTRPNGTIHIGNVLPDITNAQEATDAGTYRLDISSVGCATVTQTFVVKVGRPDLPGGPSQFEYCMVAGGRAPALTAVAAPGFVLRWYTEESGGVASSVAPEPFIGTVGTTFYYVSQANASELTCESDRRKLTVLVNRLPDPAPTLAALNICRGSVPLVAITNSDADYTYALYAVAQNGTPLDQMEGTGGTISLSAQAPLTEDVIYYVETQVTATGCRSTSRTAIRVVVTTLYLQPEVLPPYKRNEPYSVQLETNASGPTFTYSGAFPSAYFELDMSSGRISGMVPTAGSSEPRTFTVQVEDFHGCSVRREYTLRSELLISQVFSPNGDGINDHFMKGYRVVIFDRKGVKLFEGEDGWDGTRNGAVMPPDTYFYVLSYTADDGSSKKKSGHIMLLTR